MRCMGTQHTHEYAAGRTSRSCCEVDICLSHQGSHRPRQEFRGPGPDAAQANQQHPGFSERAHPILAQEEARALQPKIAFLLRRSGGWLMRFLGPWRRWLRCTSLFRSHKVDTGRTPWLGLDGGGWARPGLSHECGDAAVAGHCSLRGCGDCGAPRAAFGPVPPPRGFRGP